MEAGVEMEGVGGSEKAGAREKRPGSPCEGPGVRTITHKPLLFLFAAPYHNEEPAICVHLTLP